MREQITEVVARLTKTDNHSAGWSPQEKDISREKFYAVLADLRTIKVTSQAAAEDEASQEKAQKAIETILGKQLRKVLLEMLQNSQTYAAEGKNLKNFFDFAAQCALKEMITEKLILELFQDMFECCPESELKRLFELFKNVVLNEGDHKLQFVENDLHVCSRICRVIMSKLTVTHDLQFRGTLQRFLARCLPLTHPSGKK